MAMLLVHSPPGTSTSVKARLRKKRDREIAPVLLCSYLPLILNKKAPNEMSWRAKRHARANA
jgi:hypothetical protein